MRHILAIIFIVFIILGLCGCSEQKQAAKKTSWLLSHDKLAEACERIYPNRDSAIVLYSTKFDTLYTEGETIYDTVVFKNDSIVYREHKCPPAQIITKTQRHDSIIYRTNSAEVESWKSIASNKDKQIQQKDDIILKQQKKIDNNDKWKLWFFALLGLNVLAVVLRLFVLKKPI